VKHGHVVVKGNYFPGRHHPMLLAVPTALDTPNGGIYKSATTSLSMQTLLIATPQQIIDHVIRLNLLGGSAILGDQPEAQIVPRWQR
jgi:hypothetical protein